MKNEGEFQVGDSIVVKEGVQDPDTGFDIGGWQGRVTEVDQEEGVVCLTWDTITLKNMPYAVIEKSAVEDWKWWEPVCLDLSEVEVTTPRDSASDVADMIAELKNPSSKQITALQATQYQTIRIKNIDVVSSGQVMGLVYAFVGLLVGGIFSIFSLVSILFSFSGNFFITLFSGMGIMFVSFSVNGVLGLILGMIMAFIYNYVVGRFTQGIKFEIEV